MLSDQDIREKLLAYLSGHLTLDTFEDWIVQNTWDVHKWGSKETQNLAHSIEAKLAEHSGDHINEDVLRKNLRPLVQEYGNPQPSTSSSSLITFQGVLKTSPESSLIVVDFGAVPQFAANAELNDAEFSLT